MALFHSVDDSRQALIAAEQRRCLLEQALARYRSEQERVICGSVEGRFTLLGMVLAISYCFFAAIYVVLELLTGDRFPAVVSSVNCLTAVSMFWLLVSSEGFKSRVAVFVVSAGGSLSSLLVLLLRWREDADSASLLVLSAQGAFSALFGYFLLHCLFEERDVSRLTHELQRLNRSIEQLQRECSARRENARQ